MLLMNEKVQTDRRNHTLFHLKRPTIERHLRQNAMQASFFLMISAIISRILGLIRDMMLGAYFGASRATDALNATLPINSVYQGIITSAIAVTFITLFIEKFERNKEEALRDLTVVFNYIILGLFVVSSLLVVFSEPLAPLLAPGFDVNYLGVTARLINIIVVTSFVWSITDFLFGVSQSRKHFLITAFIPLITNLSIIGAMFLLHSRIGIYSYPTGMLVGAGIQLLIMLVYARVFLDMRFSFNFNPAGTFLKPLLLLSAPLILQQIVSYSVAVVSNNLLSQLPAGSIASIGYANKLRQLSLGILTVPLATSYYPFLSESAAKKDFAKLKEIFSKSIRFASFLIFPATFISIFFPEPIVKIVFERGVFDAKAVALTSRPFIFYSFGIFASMVNIVIMRVFYSMKETFTTLIVATISAVFNILLLYPLIMVLGHSGSPLAVSISLFLEMFIFIFLLRKRMGHMGGRAIIKSLAKLSGSSLIGVAFMLLIFKILEKFFPISNWFLALNFLISLCVFAVIYLIMLEILKAEEAMTFYSVFKKIVNRLKYSLRRNR